MKIYLLGLNHKTAPLAIREKVAFQKQKLPQALILLNSYPFIQENIILSTCNRVELYVAGYATDCLESAREFLHDYCKVSQEIDSYIYNYEGKEAIEHLFRVAASLDSMIVGENQILGQVKTAYFLAKNCKVAGKYLSEVFEKAISVGKKVRTETNIGKGAVSISTAAIELAKKVFSLENKKVLIVGAGKIGELTLRNLASRGIRTICVANRTYKKATRLAEEFGGKAIRFSSLPSALKEADIVISSTNAPHFIIRRSMIEDVMKRREKPLCLIDLGVPRNIEESVSEINNVYLYDIDDLNRVKDENLKKRLKEVKKAEIIINRSLSSFIKRINWIECPASR